MSPQTFDLIVALQEALEELGLMKEPDQAVKPDRAEVLQEVIPTTAQRQQREVMSAAQNRVNDKPHSVSTNLFSPPQFARK